MTTYKVTEEDYINFNVEFLSKIQPNKQGYLVYTIFLSFLLTVAIGFNNLNTLFTLKFLAGIIIFNVTVYFSLKFLIESGIAKEIKKEYKKIATIILLLLLLF